MKPFIQTLRYAHHTDATTCIKGQERSLRTDDAVAMNLLSNEVTHIKNAELFVLCQQCSNYYQQKVFRSKLVKESNVQQSYRGLTSVDQTLRLQSNGNIASLSQLTALHYRTTNTSPAHKPCICMRVQQVYLPQPIPNS